MNVSDLDQLLTDLTDDYWKERIKNSVLAVTEIYELTPEETLIFRETISPENLYIAAVEECVLENARKHLENNFGVGTPLTVIRHKGKNVLFMGSSRSLQYLLQNKNPDCLVINLPDHLNPKIVSEATASLREIYNNQLV
jgi:hypothetical protein